MPTATPADAGVGRRAPGAPPHRRSLQWQLLRRIVWAIAAALLLIGAVVYAFTSRTEQAHWRTRQEEAARHAVTVLAGFAQRSGDALDLVGLLDPEELRRRPGTLQPFLAKNPALLELVRLDPTGENVAQAHRDRALLANLFTLRQSLWYQRAMEGAPFAGGVEISAVNEPYLVLARPAPDGGVVAARLGAGVLWTVVGELRFGVSGITFLVNHSGRVVAHPDTARVLARTTLAGRPELAAVLAAPARAWSGTYESLDGEEVQGVSLEVPGTDWIALSEVSRAEATRASRSALYLLDGAILVFGLIGFALIARQVRQVVAVPLDRLRAGAERIGQGDLAHRIELNQPDEVGAVAAAFNEMAQRLGERDAELAAKALALSAEVAERRRSEEALRQAKEAAEAASRAKSEFLARMSHEVRTPLNGVLGMTELLAATPLDARQRRYVETVQHSGDALLRILNDILDLTRVEAGRIELASVPFDPREVLAHAVELHGSQGRHKGLAITVSVATGVPAAVTGDPHRLSQILGNLLGNAVKFTDRGEVGASLRVAEEHGDTVALEFAVQDTGIGIDPSQHGEIFEKFTQVERYLTRTRDGAGLGLAIARHLAELMGGTIEVESALGRGARFAVRLPFRRGATASGSAGQAPSPTTGAPPRLPDPGDDLPGLRVLIAEDNAVNRELLGEVLDSLGCTVDSARSGREAVETAARRRYDIILMDCQMPELDGYQATRRIRAAEVEAGVARVPIVAVTGHALAGERERCLAAGMDGFLAKPFRAEQVRSILRQWCRR